MNKHEAEAKKTALQNAATIKKLWKAGIIPAGKDPMGYGIYTSCEGKKFFYIEYIGRILTIIFEDGSYYNAREFYMGKGESLRLLGGRSAKIMSRYYGVEGPEDKNINLTRMR